MRAIVIHNNIYLGDSMPENWAIWLKIQVVKAKIEFFSLYILFYDKFYLF